MQIGIIGGTGPAGRGLAVRAAAVGHQVLLGSREESRASEVAAALHGLNADLSGSLQGCANEAAAGAIDLVVLATPWDGAVATATALAGVLDGSVVVSMVNALTKAGREMLPLYPPRGSMASQIAAALPGSKVAAAFHHLPARDMEDLSSGLESDVLVCGDDEDAVAATLAFVETIPALRGIHAGSLAQASPIEAFTATLITMNIRHKAHSTIRLAGI
jgi:8-hydroxy-5-deazaflavin:NADPH oxidoreductase